MQIRSLECATDTKALSFEEFYILAITYYGATLHNTHPSAHKTIAPPQDFQTNEIVKEATHLPQRPPGSMAYEKGRVYIHAISFSNPC